MFYKINALKLSFTDLYLNLERLSNLRIILSTINVSIVLGQIMLCFGSRFGNEWVWKDNWIECGLEALLYQKGQGRDVHPPFLRSQPRPLPVQWKVNNQWSAVYLTLTNIGNYLDLKYSFWMVKVSWSIIDCLMYFNSIFLTLNSFSTGLDITNQYI